MRKLGYVYQRGHDGLPCTNPSPTTYDQLLFSDKVSWTVPMRDCLCWEKDKKEAAVVAATTRDEEYAASLRD
jgi:hypothetical protein